MCPPRVLNLELMTQRSRGGRFSMETVGMVTSIKGGKWHRASYDNCQCPLATNIKCLSLRRVWLFATPWTVVHQAPLSTEFSRQEYWNGLPFPPPGDLPDPRIKPSSSMTPILTDSFTTEPLGKPTAWKVGVGKCSESSLKLNFPGGSVVENLSASAGDTDSQSLVWEDSTCSTATKPVHHNYWSLSTLDPMHKISHCNKKFTHSK